MVVGLLIANACRAEFQHWLQLEAKSLKPERRQEFYEEMELRGIELATQVVLKRRATNR